MTAKKGGVLPSKWHTYEVASEAEALLLAVESHRTQTAAQQLGIGPELPYRWQQA